VRCDYAGRPLLVNLWATWCAPCKAEMPTLDALAQLEEGRITVIAVSQDLQGRKPVRAFFDSARIVNLEPFTDRDNALCSAVGGNPALPTTIFTTEGKEVWRVIGGLEWDDAEVPSCSARPPERQNHIRMGAGGAVAICWAGLRSSIADHRLAVLLRVAFGRIAGLCSSTGWRDFFAKGESTVACGAA
jgi:thiol-disulfide isomerase/thioredoxin